ncbi:cell division protein FtsN [Edaphovirga cremea]|uniref:cell division protein FtsN n=1 Tax=Edaphovirga cremea TaxID=2267246 RepID=UPI0039893E12
MAQRDYVSRGRSGARRKSTSRKKKSSSSGISKTMMALAVAVLVTFIGALYFLTHNKPEDIPLLPSHNTRPGNGLPPKPEERWRYIKELENRQIGVPTPTEPSAGGEVQSQTQLTNEQRQLLEQMQADMRQQPTQLSEVPYNDKTQVPRSAVTIAPPTVVAPRQQQQVQQPVQQQPRVQQQVQQPAVQQPARVQQQTQQPQVQQQQAPVVAQAKPEKEKEKPKEKPQRWMVQCGSFRATDQAESIRAQLAFEGIESRITSGGGWSRVVLGPYDSRANADKSVQKMKSAGVSGCIPLSTGG